eukprot:TRINITY_DN39489_c0_g1_i1.p1 TRINITY_DN39489_c0_g1~~TRINITY_DN39489_c0_g1_i1.p1  ORF type:complete len:498 (-),score=69.58 TRINITY_DN39489_c0_g1_i1:2-1387(-)
MTVSKIILCVGPEGVGKTSLLSRFLEDTFSQEYRPTIGLNQLPRRLLLDPAKDHDVLPPETRAVLPADGLELEFWEIGGRERTRQLPRGRRPDGLLVCYNTNDRSSFHAAAHMLMHYRMENHLANERASLVARPAPVPRLVAVLCGTMADSPCEVGEVTMQEASEFVHANGMHLSVFTSALTRESVSLAFYALAQAMMEADEEAEAERVLAGEAPKPEVLWALPQTPGTTPASDAAAAMTNPPGLRSNEPLRHQHPHPTLVEVFDKGGQKPYGARPLSSCIALGLWHRAVHVWICDLRTGGLLLRRYTAKNEKHASRWGPSCHTEVRCYDQDSNAAARGVVASESSEKSATRAIFEQLGVDRRVRGENMWFTGPSKDGTCCELLEVYALPIELGEVPAVSVQSDEDAQWVHYLDVFGSQAVSSRSLQHFEPNYRSAMMQRLKARILHAAAADAQPDCLRRP